MEYRYLLRLAPQATTVPVVWPTHARLAVSMLCPVLACARCVAPSIPAPTATSNLALNNATQASTALVVPSSLRHALRASGLQTESHHHHVKLSPPATCTSQHLKTDLARAPLALTVLMVRPSRVRTALTRVAVSSPLARRVIPSIQASPVTLFTVLQLVCQVSSVWVAQYHLRRACSLGRTALP